MIPFLTTPILSIFLLLLVIIFSYKWLNASSTTRKNRPPSPPKLPIVGNFHQLGLNPHRSLYSLSQKYGPLMLLHIGSQPVVVASSANTACEIMRTHDLAFSNRPRSSIHNRLLYGCKDIAFAPYGEYWRWARKICALQLLSNRRVQSFRHVREEETSLMIKKIEESCSCSSSSSPLINLTEMFVSVTNNVVCRAALGRKYSDDETGKRFKLLLGELGELLGTFDVGEYIPWLAWMNRVNGLDAKVEKVAKELDEVLDGVVEEHRKKKKKEDSHGEECNHEDGGSDFVDILLDIERENVTEFPIQNETIKALILDMFTAGTDTTYTVVEWAMSELLRHPKILEKLQNEVRQVAQGKSEVTEDDLQHMKYLKAVIKESLRLHPPIPLIPRESIKDAKVMNYDIAAGSQAFVNVWAVGRDSLCWEKPEEFQPERFLDGVITEFNGFFNIESMIAFGAGRRGCPGATFGMAVNELALAKLLQKFDFALPDGARGENLDMSEVNSLTVCRKFPLLVIAIPHCL